MSSVLEYLDVHTDGETHRGEAACDALATFQLAYDSTAARLELVKREIRAIGHCHGKLRYGDLTGIFSMKRLL